MASWGVTLSKAEAIARTRSGSARVWALRSDSLILLHIFDGVEVRGVRRQKGDLSARLLNEREGQLILAPGEVVHYHQVSSS
jgi:hypothetical protein